MRLPRPAAATAADTACPGCLLHAALHLCIPGHACRVRVGRGLHPVSLLSSQPSGRCRGQPICTSWSRTRSGKGFEQPST